MRLALALLLLVPALAAAEQPGDFGYGIALETTAGSALQQLEVPLAVYEGITRADLGDVRVFNGAGEVVPHAFRPRVTATRQTLPPAAITLFAINTDAPAGVEGVELRLERRGERTVVDLRSPESKPARGARLAGYLADARAVDAPIRAIALRLPAHTEQVIARVTLEASDDLRRWDTLASGAPVVRLSSGGDRLEQLRIEVAPRRAKYLRVSWPGRSEAVALAGLEVEVGEATIEAPRQWSRLTGTAVRDRPGEYELDLGGLFPVDRLRFGLPQPNTVAALEILARARPGDAWHRVSTAIVYRLVRDGDELTSADVEIAVASDRYWLVKADQRGGGIGEGPLVFGAGWVPHRLVFAARGATPFQLVYGRRDARPAAFEIATLVPGYTGEEDLERRLAPTAAASSAITIGAAQPAAAPQKLGGAAALRGRRDWKRWALWGSLGLGVVMLGWMALRLGRQMSRPPATADETERPRRDPGEIDLPR
jgi:uncharacterized protein DUF3999